MLIEQIIFNNNYPFGNLAYVYLTNGHNIENIYKIFSEYKIINIVLTTMVCENNKESLILPKKYSEKIFKN